MSEPTIHTIFEPKTGTWQYIVADPATKVGIIIDPVLDFDPSKNAISTETADGLLAVVRENGYTIDKVLETHAHADHLTAAKYLQKQLQESGSTRPDVCIGKRITGVQERFAQRYGIATQELEGAFDQLLDDDEEFAIGGLTARAMHLPGHTPDHMGYLVGCMCPPLLPSPTSSLDARTKLTEMLCKKKQQTSFAATPSSTATSGQPGVTFPEAMPISCMSSLSNPPSQIPPTANNPPPKSYASVTKLFSLPPHFKIYTGHDYPPGPAAGRADPVPYTTVADQMATNRHMHTGTTEAQFCAWRQERDAQLGEPRLLHQSLQFNIRGGSLPALTAAGDRLVHLPVKVVAARW